MSNRGFSPAPECRALLHRNAVHGASTETGSPCEEQSDPLHRNAVHYIYFRGEGDGEHGTNTIKPALAKEFWATWRALTEAKLVESVGYIFDGEDSGSQPIHPFSPWNGTDEERMVTCEALAAAGRMVTESQLQRVMGEFASSKLYVCPVQSHVLNAQLVGIWRPVYRPNTAKTRAWKATYLDKCAAHAAIFGSLAQTATRSTA